MCAHVILHILRKIFFLYIYIYILELFEYYCMNQYILFFGDLCLCNVFSFSHRNGLRFIPESEIGLAAIHVNNKTYCNPCCSMQSGGFPYTYIHIRCRWTVLGHYSFILSSLFSVNNE